MNKFRKFLGVFDNNGVNPPTPPTPAPSPPVIQPVPPPVPPPAAGLSAEEVQRVAAQAARDAVAAERAAEAQRQKDQAAAAEAERQRQEDERTTAGQLAQMRRELNAVTNQNKQLMLNAYRNQAIANARASGAQFMDALVTGNSEKEIDASLGMAIQQTQQFLQQNGLVPKPTQPTAPTGHAGAPPAQPQVPPPSSPSFASPGNANPAAQPQQGALTAEQVAYLTSPEAVRNGHFAQYRHLLHGHMQANGAPPGAMGGNLQHPQVSRPLQYPQAGSVSGVQVPMVQPAGPMPAQVPFPGMQPNQQYGAQYQGVPPVPQAPPVPTHPMMRSNPMLGSAVQTGAQPGFQPQQIPSEAAPQPAQVEAAIRAGQPAQINVNAATAAAQAAVAAARGQSGAVH